MDLIEKTVCELLNIQSGTKITGDYVLAAIEVCEDIIAVCQDEDIYEAIELLEREIDRLGRLN